MNKLNKSLLVASALLAGSFSLNAQSFQFFGETGQLIDSSLNVLSAGSAIDSVPVNLYYAITTAATGFNFESATNPTPEEVLGAMGSQTWAPIGVSAIGGVEWQLPGTSIAVGQKPVFAFLNASDDGVGATNFALIEGAPFTFAAENRVITLGSGNWTPIVGAAGSLTMAAVVPEPSTFALLGGVLALGFVMYRRRRA